MGSIYGVLYATAQMMEQTFDYPFRKFVAECTNMRRFTVADCEVPAERIRFHKQ